MVKEKLLYVYVKRYDLPMDNCSSGCEFEKEKK